MSFQQHRKIYLLIGVLLVLTTLMVLTYNKVDFSGSDLGGNVGGALKRSRIVYERKADETLPTPIFSRLPSRISTATFVLNGRTLAGAKITVIGGPYDLSPVVANERGIFSIEVPLPEEKNQYQIKVEKDGEFAPAITAYLLRKTDGLKAAAPKR